MLNAVPNGVVAGAVRINRVYQVDHYNATKCNH
jgi:hypothetical protein